MSPTKLIVMCCGFGLMMLDKVSVAVIDPEFAVLSRYIKNEIPANINKITISIVVPIGVNRLRIYYYDNSLPMQSHFVYKVTIMTRSLSTALLFTMCIHEVRLNYWYNEHTVVYVQNNKKYFDIYRHPNHPTRPRFLVF